MGKEADINVIALNDLSLQVPYVANDLPTGAPRLLQRAEGYVATLWSPVRSLTAMAMIRVQTWKTG